MPPQLRDAQWERVYAILRACPGIYVGRERATRRFVEAVLWMARAGIGYALAEAMDDGHCGLPTDELRHLAAELLEIPPEIVGAALDLELSDGEAVADTVEDRPCVFLAGLYRAEQSIAERLVELGAGSPPWPAVGPAKAIPWVERTVGISLADSQKKAVQLALRAKVLVITGGPGVGKTTLVNAILKVLQAKTPAIALAAPTGRAAKRMSGAAGLEAKTLHRLLEADPAQGGFKRNAEHPLECDLLVVDEVSMVDVPLMHALLKAAVGTDPRRRRRPAAFGRPGAGSGRHHRLGGGAGGAVDRGISAGRPEPDHHQRPPDQPGPDAGAWRRSQQ